MADKLKGSEEEQGLPVNIPEEIKGGVYTNFASFNHTPNEFIFDFVFVHQQEGELVSRVITSPAHAKAILFALKENIDKYEEKFGEIEEADSDIDTPGLMH